MLSLSTNNLKAGLNRGMSKPSSNLIFEINEALSFSTLPPTLLLMEKNSHEDKEIWEKRKAIFSLLMSYSFGLLFTVIRGLGILILAHRSHKIRQ